MANSNKDEVFMKSIQFVLRNWPIVRLSVDQCLAGPHSKEKELWLEEVIFNVFMDNGDLDPVDIEDYLSEILSNEFNVIVEDGSLIKVAEKLCSYHNLCEKGECLKVAEEISSVLLPAMNISSKDYEEPGQRNEISEQLEDLNLTSNEIGNLEETDNTSESAETDDWVVVQRGRKKK